MEFKFISSQQPLSPELIGAFLPVIKSFNPNMFVTFQPNLGRTSYEFGRKVLRKVFRETEKRLSGRDYWKHPELRIRGIAFGEKWSYSSHYHCFVSVPPHAIDRFSYRVRKIWKNKVPSGTSDVQRIYELEPVARYALKSQHLQENFEALTILEDLWIK